MYGGPAEKKVGVAEGIWEFPKIGVPYFGGPYNKDPTSTI